MRSKVAEDVRDALQQEELALTPSERLQRAFDLGEEDLRLFAAANGLTRKEACLDCAQKVRPDDATFRSAKRGETWLSSTSSLTFSTNMRFRSR